MKNTWFKKRKETILKKSLKQQDVFHSFSSIPIDRVYTPPILDDFYNEKLGIPGEYPFTRGIHSTMYRGRLWTMRLYAGFSTAEETNKRYKYLLDNGTTGLSVAFDLPTQLGYDSDDPKSRGEVGKVGVAIDSLADMEILFDSIPLDKVSTSMTINAPAAILLAMYAATGEQQKVSRRQLTGTIQNDILKEYIARGTYIFPPLPSLRLATDIFRWCVDEMPRFNMISVSGYHIREAGSSAVQEIAFTLANASVYVQAAIDAGISVDSFAPRMAFFFNSSSDFFEEIAKFRAARRMWANIMKDKFHAKEPASRMLRFHTQTAGHTLTAQQTDNNIIRVTLQALAAALGGTQSLHTNSKDEALGLPTEQSATLALRTQQILAYESGIAKTVDPLGGSYFIEHLTDELEKRAIELMNTIDQNGGVVQSLKQRFIQTELENTAFENQRAINTKKHIVVGVNAFESHEKQTVSLKK